MFSRLPISSAQLKEGNNSEKHQKEIKQLHYLNMETIFMNTENSKTNESNKCIHQFTDKHSLKNPNNKNIVLVNLSIYYTGRNIKSAYNNTKFKISAPTWNDKFDLPDGSYSISDIQDYFEYVIKNMRL